MLLDVTDNSLIISKMKVTSYNKYMLYQNRICLAFNDICNRIPHFGQLFCNLDYIVACGILGCSGFVLSVPCHCNKYRIK
jgi:hypothetical protein